MAKLWQKNYTLDDLMQHFTVRTDYILDQELVISDALASCAHARGLERIGILKKEELEKLESGLKEIVSLRLENHFEITEADEDCHTAIEGYLTKKLGDIGKKIHTGRSRNDQVQTALRIYMREVSARLAHETLGFASELLDFSRKYEGVPMPGRTHMQIAMPSSVGLWAASFAEELIDEARLMLDINWLLDQSPLGSAASYGAPIPLDREFTAEQMGFGKVQNNVLYANNSRGKFEAILLDQCNYIALTISKLSQDLILFTLPEFGYFSLPVELTTGSSIMPQKKNPDGLELARSRSALIDSCAQRVKNSIRSLPSGYNRDFQDTKEPLIEGVKETWALVSIMKRMVSGLIVHEDRLVKACVPELYATDKVFDKVMQGGTFRDSYKSVGLNLEDVEREDPYEALKKRTSTGTSGKLNLDTDMKICKELINECDDRLDVYFKAYSKLLCLDGLCAVNW